MLTARQVLTATLLVAALSLVGMGISLWHSMEPSPLGSDSYGTRAHGERGVLDLLTRLNVPIERELLPPEAKWNRPTTLVIWGPHHSLVQLEPAYLADISNWVKGGGRVVVAIAPPNSDEVFQFRSEHLLSQKQISIPEELGLANVRTELVDLDLRNVPQAAGDPADVSGVQKSGAASDGLTRPAKVAEFSPESEVFSTVDTKTLTADVSSAGDLAEWKDTVAKLEVPAHRLQVIDVTDTAAKQATNAAPNAEAKLAAGSVVENSALGPAGWLKIEGSDGVEHTLVASYRIGRGEIVLVGDPQVLENHFLGQADNSLLAWRLLAADGRAVVWDEFYHGLTIRGNPLYILRRPPFGALMVAGLVLISVCIWRQAVRFGPPLSPAEASRRTVGEYVETMARLFRRSRRSQPFLLVESRNGTLWFLRCELGLPLGQEKLETIAAVLRRRRPEQAASLTDAVGDIDRALAAGRDLSEKETVLTLQRITDCL